MAKSNKVVLTVTKVEDVEVTFELEIFEGAVTLMASTNSDAVDILTVTANGEVEVNLDDLSYVGLKDINS